MKIADVLRDPSLACYVVFRKTKRHKTNDLERVWSPLSDVAVLDIEGRPVRHISSMHMHFEAATNTSILNTIEIVTKKDGTVRHDRMGGFLQRSKRYLVLDVLHMPSKQFDRLNQTIVRPKT